MRKEGDYCQEIRKAFNLSKKFHDQNGLIEKNNNKSVVIVYIVFMLRYKFFKELIFCQFLNFKVGYEIPWKS